MPGGKKKGLVLNFSHLELIKKKAKEKEELHHQQKRFSLVLVLSLLSLGGAAHT